MRCRRVQLEVLKRMYQCGPCTHVRWLPTSFFFSCFVADARLALASYDILKYMCTTFGLFALFPRVFLSSRVTGACPTTADLIMRVNVRTTTATTHIRPEAIIGVHRAGELRDTNDRRGGGSPTLKFHDPGVYQLLEHHHRRLVVQLLQKNRGRRQKEGKEGGQGSTQQTSSIYRKYMYIRRKQLEQKRACNSRCCRNSGRKAVVKIVQIGGQRVLQVT